MRPQTKIENITEQNEILDLPQPHSLENLKEESPSVVIRAMKVYIRHDNE
jgi:hypothetical protein